MPAHSFHPIFPVRIKAPVLREPKLAKLTSIVIIIPDIPLTGKLLTTIETTKNLSTSTAWLKKYIKHIEIRSVGKNHQIKIASPSFRIKAVMNTRANPNF